MTWLERTIFAICMVALGWHARTLYFKWFILRRAKGSWRSWDQQEANREIEAVRRLDK